MHLCYESPGSTLSGSFLADGTNLTESWFLKCISLKTDDQTTHREAFSLGSPGQPCVTCTVSMLCVYSVNMCGVSRWIAVLIVLPLNVHWIIMVLCLERAVSWDWLSRWAACGSLLKEAGKKRDKGRQSEKNVKSVQSYNTNISICNTWNHLIIDHSLSVWGWGCCVFIPAEGCLEGDLHQCHCSCPGKCWVPPWTLPGH